MKTATTDQHGCGGTGACACAAKAAGEAPVESPAAPASINGIALLPPELSGGGFVDADELRERAYTEILRQHAVKSGLLPRKYVLVAPDVTNEERGVLERMVEDAVSVPRPTPEECRRYFEARKTQYVVGQAVHLRHILFAVTPGVNVHALTVQAEKALIGLLGKQVPIDAFATLASEMSNCPSGARGGDLGWVTPQECAPELANELFFQTDSRDGLGVHPRLIHTRFGFHIIDVISRRKGKAVPYEEVATRVEAQLLMQTRAKAMHQYMSLLAGQALIEGLTLQTSDSLLVQ